MATAKTKTAIDTAADLRAPFDEDQIEEVDGFSNVEPFHYLERLMDAAAGKYSITRQGPFIIKHGDAAAVAVNTTVTIDHSETSQSFGDIGAKPLDNSDESKQLAYAIKSASSDSLKRSLLGAGLGIDLYKNESEEPPAEKPAKKPARRTTREEPEDEDEAPPRRRGASGGGKGKWTGDEEIAFGAHKGTPYNEVIGSWLAYCEKTFDEGKNLTMVQNEIKRRKDEDTWDPTEGDKKPTARRQSRRPSGRGNRDDI